MRSFLNYSKNRFLYGLLKFGLLFLLGYLGLSYFTCMQVDAATVPSIRNGMNYFVYGNSATEFLDGNQAFSVSGNLPVYPFYGQAKIYQHFSWRGMEFIANSPIQGQGISYIITAKFRLLMDGLDNAIANSTFTGCVQFEQGTIVQKTCDVAVGDITAGGATFTIQSTIGLQSTTNLSSLLFSLYATNGSLGTYNIAGGSSAFTTQLSLLDVDVTISQDPNTAILGGIQQEQQETNDKLDDLNKNQEEIKDAITDETPPNLDGLENSAGWLPAGPVDSILNLPISLLNNLTDNLGGTCQPAHLTIPFINKTIILPCMSEIYEEIGISAWINTIGTLASAFIAYYYLLELYKWVDNVLTMRENQWNDVDQWGGI